jgi:signal transduction histidine kinase
MNLRQASLSRRLLAGAAIFIAVAMIVSAIVIAYVLQRFIQGQIDQRLDTQITFLSSMLSVGEDRVLALTGDTNGPPFDRPGRGWTWAVIGPVNTLSARSLDGAVLVVPAVHKSPDPGRPAPADGMGPGNQHLHFRVQEVQVGATRVTIVATAPRAAVSGPLQDAMTTLAVSLAALWLALMLAILLQVRLGLRPLERLRKTLGEIRRGAREAVPTDQPAEILPLVTELNALLAQNEANLERARGHAANLAHGLKTPLATLALALSEPDRRVAGELQALVAVMERRIRHHLARARFAALNGSTRARTEVAPHLASLGDALRKIHADRALTLALAVQPTITIACEQQDFDEMAGNLLDNAFRWAKSRIRVEARSTEANNVLLTIDDDGPGLSQEQLPEVLRPGKRMDEAAPGFGFGLPITRELAELYGGTLELGASPLGGLRVALRLPASDQVDR